MPPAIAIGAAAALGAAAGAAGAFTAFAIAGSFALAGALTFGGLALAQYLLTPKPASFDIGTVRADTRSTLRIAVAPARWVLGRARIASVLTYYLEPEKNDREAYLVLTICEGPIEGIERIWIDGKEIPWNDGTTNHALGAKGDIIKEYARVTSPDDYDGSLYMTFFYNGAERLDGSFPKPEGTDGFADNQWTSDHKLSGKAVVLIQLYQPGYGTDASSRVWHRLPNFEFLVKGQKISYPGVSTPTWTENAAAVRYWWLTERRGLPSAAIHPQDFVYAFQICDEVVHSNLPAEYSEYDDRGPRYTINGVVYSNDEHESVEAEMDFAWAGYAMEVNGSYRFRPGLDRPISITIGPEDIIERGTDVAAPALSDRINSGSMRIAQSCVHDFTELALPEFKDDEAILRDGQKLPKDFRVRPYISCPVAGGRLLAIMLRRARANKVYSRQITPGDRFERLNLIPTDRVMLSDPEYGLVDVPVVITSRTMNEDWSLNISFEEAPDDIYSPSLVLPPLYPNALTPINVLRGPNIPANVIIYAEAILTLDYTVHSVIHVSWDDSPHRTRIVVEFLDITKITTFRDEKLVSGTDADFIVPYEGVYRVSVWHVNIRNVLSLPYTQDVLIDWSNLNIIPLDQRVNDFIDQNEAYQNLLAWEENESYQNLVKEAERANTAADRATAAALLSEEAATASSGDASSAAGSATLSEQEAEASEGSATAAATSAASSAARARNAQGSATAAATSARTASASADTATQKAAAANTDAAEADTEAAAASASAVRAAASETSASGSSAAAQVSRTAAAASANTAGEKAIAASDSAVTATTQATLSGRRAEAASTDAVTADTEATAASASAVRAAASASGAGRSSSAARVSQIAAATSATSAGTAVAGLDAKVATSVDNKLDTTFAAAVVLRAKAGSAGARLELVALSSLSGSASSARLGADEIIIDSDNFRVNAMGELVVHSIAAAQIKAGSITADEIKAGSITAAEISNTTGILRNIIILPDLSTGETGQGLPSTFEGLQISSTATTVTFRSVYHTYPGDQE